MILERYIVAMAIPQTLPLSSGPFVSYLQAIWYNHAVVDKNLSNEFFD